MALFNSPKATVPPAPGMPPGFDDDESPFFIPEQLRPYYLEAKVDWAKTDEARDQRVKDVAWARAEQELGAFQAAPDHFESPRAADQRIQHNVALRELAASLAPRILSEHYEHLTALARHTLRLEVAAEAQNHAERRREDEERFAKQNTCPVCGTLAKAPELGSPVKERPRWPHASRAVMSGTFFRSCAWCYEAVLEHDREEALSAQTHVENSGLLDLATRRERVRAHLAS